MKNINREELTEKLIEAYRSALENHSLFQVVISEKNEIYLNEEASGSSCIPCSVWNGNDTIVATYDGGNVNILDMWCDERTIAEVAFDCGYLTEEQKAEFQQKCIETEATDRWEKEDVFENNYNDIIDEMRADAIDWAINEYSEGLYEKVNTILCECE